MCDEFLTKIKNLAKTCDFDTLHDSLVMDKLIIGIRSEKVRERSEENLTLNIWWTICRASEQATTQLAEMKVQDEAEVHKVKTESKATKVKTDQRKDTEEFNSKRCGMKHKPKSCHAFKNTCAKCNKQGHFSSQCWSKSKTNVKNKQKNMHVIQDE